MTLTIEVSGELEVALLERANRVGLTTDRVARNVLSDALTPGLHQENSLSPTVTDGAEKAKAFVEWAKSHRYTPPLSDEAISRDNMYPDRL